MPIDCTHTLIDYIKTEVGVECAEPLQGFDDQRLGLVQEVFGLGGMRMCSGNAKEHLYSQKDMMRV